MTKLLEQAVEKLSLLPHERQNELARMLIDVAAQDIHPYTFSPQERIAVEEGLAQAEFGEFATDTDVAAMWTRFGV